VEQVFPGGLSAHAKAMRIEPGTYVGAQISGNGKLTITTPVRAVLDGCAFQIQEGADVTDTGSGYVINKGEAVMDSGAESEGVHISQVQGGSEGRAFQVETRGVFLRRKDGSFTMKSGRISIRAGILVVEGVGAVFEKGSVVGRR
jgi:hypothetical protein